LTCSASCCEWAIISTWHYPLTHSCQHICLRVHLFAPGLLLLAIVWHLWQRSPASSSYTIRRSTSCYWYPSAYGTSHLSWGDLIGCQCARKSYFRTEWLISRGCRGYGDSHGYGYGIDMGTVINYRGFMGILWGFLDICGIQWKRFKGKRTGSPVLWVWHSVGIPTIFSVGTGWVWGLKSKSYGSPAVSAVPGGWLPVYQFIGYHNHRSPMTSIVQHSKNSFTVL